MPVKNEGINLTIMLKILRAVVDVPHEVLVVVDRDGRRQPHRRRRDVAGLSEHARRFTTRLGAGILNALRAGVAAGAREVRVDFRGRRSRAGAGDRRHDRADGAGLRLRQLHAIRVRRPAARRLVDWRRAVAAGELAVLPPVRLPADRRDDRDQDVQAASCSRQLHLEARPIGWAVAFEMGDQGAAGRA